MNLTDKWEGASGNHTHPLIEAIDLTKDFPGLRALDNVNFALESGEVHVLFGENGAGKSTLISLLAGADRPTSGEIRFDGHSVEFANVHEARELGISAVFQEFSLIPQMTVSENILLGSEPTTKGWLDVNSQNQKVQEILEDLNFEIEPHRKVEQLSRAEQQMVEIAKAFRSNLSVLILDEPTASLTIHETGQLFKLIARLKENGVGIIYITHRLAEIREIGDRITVLRDGQFIDCVDANSSKEEELVNLMTGRVVGQIFPTIKSSPNQTILEVENLTSKDGSLHDVSISVKQGEIVGLAGLVGSGKSRCGQACFGALPLRGGNLKFKGNRIESPTVRRMMDMGMLYLPPDRRKDGLFMMRSARENVSISSLWNSQFSNWGFLKQPNESTIVGGITDRLNLSPNRIEQIAERFSGGNQQKLMLARCLAAEYDLTIFDEPTVGVDVSARVAIYSFLAELCENGVAVILISSDLPEILHLSHRTYVFHQGRVQAELVGSEITEFNVLSHFFERQTANVH